MSAFKPYLPRVRWLFPVLCMAAGGCWSASGPEVVVYTALDSEFSGPIFDDFEARTGITVRAKFDAESTKTVGLANLIIEEGNRPRCDVFWNNEILHTLRLQREGLLAVYRSPAAEDFPRAFRSAEGIWHGFAARARVLIVNTELVADEAERPGSILDMADPKWRGRCAMALPLFGTTATHAACLFVHWGDQRAKEFFGQLKANEVKILSGNKQVARDVAAGQYAFGLTDTDDAIIEQESGWPVAIVYPDQDAEGPDQDAEGLGTLFIPNTVAIIRDGPNAEHARRLVDYLLSPGVEAKLAACPSAQIPLNPKVEAKVRVQTPRTVKAMSVDFNAAAAKWDTAAKFIDAEFGGD